MGPRPSEIETETGILQKQHAKLQYKSNRQFRDSLLQSGPIQKYFTEISYQKVYVVNDVEEILVNIELISRYTIPPRMGLPI